MATYGEQNGRNEQFISTKEPFEEKECERKLERSSKDLQRSDSSAESNTSGVASFTTNHNSVVCLPLVSEGLKLVWTQSDQTRELDTIPELVQAFNIFPYPSSHEVSTLARLCALPLDKVKVWFMVQRIKYGISWSSEEIEETRRKLAVPELYEDSTETTEEAKISHTSNVCEELIIEDKDSDDAKDDFSSFVLKKTKPKCESPDTYKPIKPTAPCFSSTLPPPQDSYFYRPPADVPVSTTAGISLDLSESSSQQHRHGRYKKSKVQLAALRKSFLRENWPAEAELRRLQEETGLSRNDIRKWFSDSRYQLRVGRGSLAAAQNYSQHTAVGSKHDQQTQPLSLVNQKSRQSNDMKGHEGVRSNGIRNSHFFQTFLSNSLEAFGEKVLEAGCDVVEELSGDGDTFKDAEQKDDQPLQLTKISKIEPDVLQKSPGILMSSPYSSSSGSSPLTASPNKSLSASVSTSKKSSRLAKAIPTHTPLHDSETSLAIPRSPSLTPAGRPRKTKDQLDVLKQHFLRCQWPKSEDYTELVKLTGLPRADVIQWFGDTRYAVKNGQLRWVKGVRDQFLSELAAQQSSNGLTNGSSSGTSARVGGNRKRKYHGNGTGADSPDTQPLVMYYLSTGSLHEKDLDSLCKKSRMSYQQVRDWFAAQNVAHQEPNITIETLESD